MRAWVHVQPLSHTHTHTLHSRAHTLLKQNLAAIFRRGFFWFLTEHQKWHQSATVVSSKHDNAGSAANSPPPRKHHQCQKKKREKRRKEEEKKQQRGERRSQKDVC